MAIIQPDTLPEELKERLADLRAKLHGHANIVLPVIGSGLSHPVLPSRAEFLMQLIDRASPDRIDRLKQLLDHGAYTKVARSLEKDSKVGKRTIAQFIERLYQRPQKQPPEIYALVAALPVEHFVTTGWEPWLKDAVARQLGTVPKVLTPHDSGAFADMLPGSPPLVLMLHGDADRPETCALSQGAYGVHDRSSQYRIALEALAAHRRLLFIADPLAEPDLVMALREWSQVFRSEDNAPQHVFLGADLAFDLLDELGDLGVEPIDYGLPQRLAAVLQYLAQRPDGMVTISGKDAPGPLRPRVLVAGPSFGMPDALWQRVSHMRLDQVTNEFESNAALCRAQMSAMVRHDIIIDVSPWRAFSRWQSIGCRDALDVLPGVSGKGSLEVGQTGIPRGRAPDTLMYFAFPAAGVDIMGSDLKVPAAITKRLSRVLTKVPALNRCVAESAADHGISFAGFCKPAHFEFARPIWDVWGKGAAGAVVHEPNTDWPSWLGNARVEKPAAPLDAPLQNTIGADYLRALRIVAGQVKLVGELHHRPIEDVFVEMEVEREEQFHGRQHDFESRFHRARDRASEPSRAGRSLRDDVARRGLELDAEQMEALLREEERNWSGRVPDTQRIRANKLLDLAPRIYLEGDAGTGKSTFLRWLAVQAARKPGRLGEPSLWPVWVELSRLRADQRLASECAEQALEAVFLPASGPVVVELTERLVHGRALLLLDGLDEAAPRVRNALSARLQDEIGDRCQVILTSRPLVKRERHMARLERVRLWGLAAQGAWEFLSKYFGHTSWIAELIAGLQSLPDGTRWRRTPVLLSLAATHLAGGHTLPGDTLDLYGAVIDRLLALACKRAGVSLTEAQAAHQALQALAANVLLPENDAPRARVRDSDLPEDHMIRSVMLGSGLFFGTNPYRFAHLTLGEYLAGRWNATTGANHLSRLRVHEELCGSEALPMAHALAGEEVLEAAFDLAVKEADAEDRSHSRLRLVLRALAYGGPNARRFAIRRGHDLVQSVVEALCPQDGRFSTTEEKVGHDAERAFFAVRDAIDDQAWQLLSPLYEGVAEVGLVGRILAWTLGAPASLSLLPFRNISQEGLERMVRAMRWAQHPTRDGRFGGSDIVATTRGEPSPEVRAAAVRALSDDTQTLELRRQFLRDKDYRVRAAAVSALSDDTQTLELRRQLLRDHFSTVRATAVRALSNDIGSLELRRQHLRDRSSTVRAAAMSALSGDFGSLELRRQLLRDHFSIVRATAVRTLSGDSQSLELRRQLLHDRSATVRGAAVSALLYDAQSLELRRQLLRDEDYRVRAAAVSALSNDRDALQPRRQLLRDSSSTVRAAAVSALSNDPGSLELRRQLLRDHDEDVRAAAVSALSDDLQSLELRRQLLHDHDADVRAAAVSALSHDTESLELRRQLLRDRSATVRATAVSALSNDPESLELRRQRLRDEDSRVRAAAVGALSRDPQSLEFRRRLLREDYPNVRVAAVSALSYDPESLELRRELLHDHNEDVRAAAVNALSDDPQSLELRRQLLRDLSPTVRAAAVSALSNDPESLELRRRLLHDRRSTVRVATVSALSDDPESLELLRQLLHDHDEYVQAAAVRALSDDPESLELRRQLLRDRDDYVQAAAVSALSDDPESLELRRQLLRDQDESVRAAAVSALSDDIESLELRRQLLSDPSSAVRVAAVNSLSDDLQSLGLHRQLLRDHDEDVRTAAVSALSDDPDSLELRRQLLRDHSATVRAAASASLRNSHVHVDAYDAYTPLLTRTDLAANDALLAFLAEPRAIHARKQPALAHLILAWITLRLAWSNTSLDMRSGRPFGILHQSQSSLGEAHVIHLAMEPERLPHARMLYPLHNTIEAWQIARLLHVVNPTALLLACADVSFPHLHALVPDVLTELPRGEPFFGRAFFGFWLPHDSCSDTE